jgi:hypothetical protein
VPALTAAVLYGLISFVIVPLVRRHRERYAQYLPLDSFQRHSDGLRDRLSTFVMRLVFPRRQAVFDASGSRRGSRSGSGDEYVFSDGEGDRMAGFDADTIGRRLEQQQQQR